MSIIIWPFILPDDPPRANKVGSFGAGPPRPTKEQRAGSPMTPKQVAQRAQDMEFLARVKKGR